MGSTSVTLGGVQAVAAIATDGQVGGAAGFNIVGTFVGTLLFEASMDNANWFPVMAFPINSGALGNPRSSVVAAAALSQAYVVPVYGYAAVRARVTAYTSGAAAVSMDTSAIFADTGNQLPGALPTYSATGIAATPTTTANVVAALFGVAGYAIKITRVAFSTSATAVGVSNVLLQKWVGGSPTAVGTAFTVTTSAIYDSLDPASAVIAGGLAGIYAANPTAGTLKGTIAGAATATITSGQTGVVMAWQFGDRPAKCPVLRNTTEAVVVNLNGLALLTGELFTVTYEWTEELGL